MKTDWAAAVSALLNNGLTAQNIADATHSSRQAVYLWAAGKREPQGSNITLITALCNKHNIALRTKLRA
jgi:hypothetical protein